MMHGSEPGAILFLDFDGVTHGINCPTDELFRHLDQLEEWLRAHANVDVVISSSWREWHPLEEMRSYFSEDLQARVIGATPILKRDPWAQTHGERLRARYERESEILRWQSQEAMKGCRWAALDDQAVLFQPRCPQLVLCDGRVGLAARELDAVWDILSVGFVRDVP